MYRRHDGERGVSWDRFKNGLPSEALHFDGAIFDMDGVITKTAVIHFAAWKKTFDAYLRRSDAEYDASFREFTHSDYLAFVDGRPRYEGVTAFLRSRGRDLPFGDPKDEPNCESICGLGNRKDELLNRMLEEDGVEVFDSTIALIEQLLRNGVKVGVATSSKNGALVLEKAGITELIGASVDGLVSAQLGLKGKPEPDIFVAACDRLGVEHHRTMIVEDATCGVQAGAKGRFGLILGVARQNNAEELRRHGADLVVSDLSQISLCEIDRWFESKHGNLVSACLASTR
ncbi:MAG: HAD family hydrolase [Rhizomicrobium sp.]